MTDRVLPLADGAPACPFVAFEDDRDERASVPDHRHRCYADARPAPRALAHQEAYCLSSAFPVCPTFQDWARREAARSRGGPPSAPSASAGMSRAAGGAALAADAASSFVPSGERGLAGDRDDSSVDATRGRAADAAHSADAGATAPGSAFAIDDGGPIAGSPRDDEDRFDDPGRGAEARDPYANDFARRNPPRDWAAPPPWLASDEGRRRDDSEPPAFLGRRASEPGQGLAGSPADRMAGGPPPTRRAEPDEGVWSSDSRSAAAIGAGLAGGAADPSLRRGEDRDIGGGRQGALDDVTDDADDARRVTRRPRAYAQHLGGPDGPDWERPRRYEDYPMIRTRVGLPAVPRIVALTGAVAVLALALFFLGPVIFDLGAGKGTPGASAGPSQGPIASASVAPTVPPAPTPTLYTIKHGDTLSKIATQHGITIEELMAANPTIKNPDHISEGQQITIPLPSQPPPDTIGGSAAP